MSSTGGTVAFCFWGSHLLLSGKHWQQTMENITILHGYINIYQLSNYGHVLFGKSCKHVYKGPGQKLISLRSNDRRERESLSCGESGNGAIGVAIHGIPWDLGFSTMTQDPGPGSPIFSDQNPGPEVSSWEHGAIPQHGWMVVISMGKSENLKWMITIGVARLRKPPYGCIWLHIKIDIGAFLK